MGSTGLGFFGAAIVVAILSQNEQAVRYRKLETEGPKTLRLCRTLGLVRSLGLAASQRDAWSVADGGRGNGLEWPWGCRPGGSAR